MTNLEKDFSRIEVNKLPELEKYMLHKIFVLNKNFHKILKIIIF